MTADAKKGAPIRFMISDVDGTLVTPDKDVTPAAVEAVRALRAAGAGFAFVSSRPPKGLRKIADALSIADGAKPGQPAAAAFNGGALLDANLETLSFAALGDDDARVALAALTDAGVDVWVFTMTDWMLVDPSGHYVAHEQHTVDFPPTVVPSFDGVTGIGKIVGSSTDFALLERLEQSLATTLSPAAKALRSQTYYLDVTHADANKGAALRTIAAHEGIGIDQVAAIGDMVNDLSMLEIAGLSIAMGNGADAVKAAADEVTASNRDDGFAKAIHDFVLPRVGGA